MLRPRFATIFLVLVVITATLSSGHWSLWSQKLHTEFLPSLSNGGLTFPSATAPGVDLYTKAWPVSNPKAVVFIIHGFGEYIGRYDGVASKLNENQISVFGLDHQGHGMSGGDRAYVNDFMDYTFDYLAYVNHTLQSNEPSVPVFLLGHSMGGAIALQTVLHNPNLWKGAIISGPALQRPPVFLKYLVGMIADYLPKLPIPGYSIDASGLNSDPLEVASYQADEMIYHGSFRANWGKAIIEGIENVWTKAEEIKIPILLMHGSKDTICPLEDTVEYSKKISNNMKLLTYKEARHELWHERNKENVMKDLVSWINEKISVNE